MTVFSEKFLSESDFEAVLATFCCYDYGVDAFEAVERIAKDQKEYHKNSLCLIVCCRAKNIINNSKRGYLLGHLRRSNKNCRSCTKRETVTGHG